MEYLVVLVFVFVFAAGVLVGRLWADRLQRQARTGYVSRRGADGLCVYHHRPVGTPDGICPECRAENARTGGDYLQAFGQLRKRGHEA